MSNQPQNLENYISKIIDRNLQKRRESGLTFYALLAITASSLFFLVKNFTYINSSESNLPLIVSFILNSIFVLTMLMFFVFNNYLKLKSKVRIRTQVDKKSKSIFLFGVGIAFSMITLLNYLFFSQSNTEFAGKYFYLTTMGYFGILTLILFIDYLFKVIKISNKTDNYVGAKTNHHIFNSNELVVPDEKQSNSEKLIWLGIFIAPILGTIALQQPWTFIDKISPEDFSISIQFSLAFSGFCACVVLLFRHFSLQQYYNWIQALEIAIHTKGFNSDEVKKKLSSYFYGLEFTDWFANNKKELERKIEEVKKILSDSKGQIESIESNNLNSKEVTKILSETRTEIWNARRSYSRTFEGIEKNINRLIKKDLFEEDDINLLKTAQNELLIFVTEFLMDSDKIIEKITERMKNTHNKA